MPGGCPLCAPDVDVDVDELALEASILREDFGAFAARFWPVVTGAPLVPNRATDAIVAALQRVADGELTRLLIAVPPGTGKSTLLALYAAWRLARDAGHRSIHAAHAFELAATESRRVRRLVEGDEYRRLFPAVELRADESTVAHWATTRDGRYICVGTDGALTGRRAHEAVLDDPLNAPDRYSRAAREALWSWFQEALSTRLDGDRAPIVVVQQRLDVDDLIGRLIAAGGWTLIELPAEGDDGELLAPGVLSREKLDALKAQIGSAAYTTQYLQRPADDSTAIVRRSWWKRFAADELPAMDRVAIACDPTFGSAKGDFAVAQVWGAHRGNRYLLHEWRQRAGLEVTLGALRALAARWPGAAILVEKAALGAGIVETLARELPGVIAVPATGSKAQRLAAIAPQVESGACFLPAEVEWLDEWIDELAGGAKHDDRADACAYALAYLAAANEGREALRRQIRLYDPIPNAVRALGDAAIDEYVELQIDNAERRERGEPAVPWEPPAKSPEPTRDASGRPIWKKVRNDPPPRAYSDFERACMIAEGGLLGPQIVPGPAGLDAVEAMLASMMPRRR